MHQRTLVALLSLVASFACQQKAALAQVIPKVGKASSVCLQSWMGTFVSADDSRGGLLVVNRPTAKRPETFKMKRIDDDHVSLKASNGKYVNAKNGGGSIVIANADEPLKSEKFAIYIDKNGLVSIAARKGQFLSAEKSGILLANGKAAGESESFRVTSPDNANSEYTRVVVNVYKIVSAPFWHTGTVIDGREYYFQTNNKVETCKTPKKCLDVKFHRAMVRFVPGNAKRVEAVRAGVASRWNGTRYDVTGHNCNFFTDDLLQSLGAPGLDQEYLNASGIAKGVRQVPGGATAQELIVKWPIKDKRMDKAFMDDVQQLARLPDDTRKEIEKAGGTISDETKKAGKTVSNETKKAGGAISKAGKKLLGH
jgi:hypothetical protein